MRGNKVARSTVCMSCLGKDPPDGGVSFGFGSYIQLKFIMVAASLNSTVGEMEGFEGSHRGYRRRMEICT